MDNKIDAEYLRKFEDKLIDQLLRLCTQYNMLSGMFLANEDIDNQWTKLAPNYMADAVPEVQNYPLVSVSWAAYLGMAVAMGWDSDWTVYNTFEYNKYYGPRGFDDMDEHILYNMLQLKPGSEEVKKIENMVRRCGETTVSMIYHEQVDPQTPMAFHVFARACRTMFRFGASMELHRRGYIYEKISLN